MSKLRLLSCTPKQGIALAILAVAFSGCRTAGPNTAAGGLFGTAAGGLVGAAIGAHEGKAGEGALIGGLAGGTMGSILGNQSDRAIRQDEQAYRVAEQRMAASAISMDQVVQMTRSGLSDDLIATQIDTQGVVSSPTTDDLILLKQNGVSDRVIQTLQSARPRYLGRRAAVAAPGPMWGQPAVIYGAPACPGSHCYRPPIHPHDSEFEFEFGF